VPAHSALAAGARALREVVFGFDWREPLREAVTQAGGTVEVEVPLPPPAAAYASSRHEITANLVDADGTSGALTRHAATVQDPRLPSVPRTAAGLLWTSRPGASEEVELGLSFAAAPNAAYRVYLTDEIGLQVRESVPEGGRLSRASVADLGVRSQDGVIANQRRDRNRYRLLTSNPVKSQGDTLSYTLLLPRSLQTVQFLRFVPVTDAGVESAFADVPLVAVAVPLDRRAPAPRLEVRTKADATGVHVNVVAEGIDFALLGEAGGPMPEFRLRRAAGPVASAIYAPVIGSGRLEMRDERLEADFEDDQVEPFVRYTYWAEVRMPPEKRLAEGEEVFPAGVVTPATAAQREDAAANYSLPSPATMVVTRTPTPPTLASAQVEVALTAAAPPRRFKVRASGLRAPVVGAIGSFALQAYQQTQDGDWQRVGPPRAVDAAAVEVEVGDCSNVGLVLVDPLGRRSPMHIAAAPQA
jgi:hypothetical protein